MQHHPTGRDDRWGAGRARKAVPRIHEKALKAITTLTALDLMMTRLDGASERALCGKLGTGPQALANC